MIKQMPDKMALHVRNALISRRLPVLSTDELSHIYDTIYEHLDCADDYCAKKVTWSKERADIALAPYREAKELSTSNQWATVGMSATELAALYLHANRISGMCPNEKIYALATAMSVAPIGDVVEIGTWWGKSALALLLLARRYGIGNVLCVDPWKDDELVQGVPHVDEASAALSAEEAFEVFKMNLLPYVNDKCADFSYLRGTSCAVRGLYNLMRPGTKLARHSNDFGPVEYAGRIALLHIDGNHAYDKVAQDVALWTPLVVPGGWVVVDDYDWRHGDGPKRAADEYIARAATQRHFVAGGAMFIQTGERE